MNGNGRWTRWECAGDDVALTRFALAWLQLIVNFLRSLASTSCQAARYCLTGFVLLLLIAVPCGVRKPSLPSRT
jgi:hypothetical protein